MELDAVAEEVVHVGARGYSESPGDGDEHAARIAIRPRLTCACEHCNTSYTEKRALASYRQTDLHRHKLSLPPA